MSILLLGVGLLLLTGGAELLVRSASQLAAAAGISPLVVGLTVVAFGTSAPEMVVSIQAMLSGQPDLALGNVVGSNIFNVLFILGASAAIVPLQVSQQLIRFDVPLMVVLSFVLLLFARDGRIGRIDGLILTTGLVAYTCWAIVTSRRERADVTAEYSAEFGVKGNGSGLRGILKNCVLLVVGLAVLVLGSRCFVAAAVMIARKLGVSELVIGLTIMAAGTSLPEAATSILAAIRGERDIAVGNVVGSNLFNIMGVLGLCGLISADGVAVSRAALQLDIPVMIAVAVACLPIFFTEHRIARWEGFLFLGYYCAYTAALVFSATDPALTRTGKAVMFGGILPLTVITLLIGVIRCIRASSRAAGSGNSGQPEQDVVKP